VEILDVSLANMMKKEGRKTASSDVDRKVVVRDRGRTDEDPSVSIYTKSNVIHRGIFISYQRETWINYRGNPLTAVGSRHNQSRLKTVSSIKSHRETSKVLNMQHVKI